MNTDLPESVRRMMRKACDGAPTWTPEQLAILTPLLKRRPRLLADADWAEGAEAPDRAA